MAVTLTVTDAPAHHGGRNQQDQAHRTYYIAHLECQSPKTCGMASDSKDRQPAETRLQIQAFSLQFTRWQQTSAHRS